MLPKITKHHKLLEIFWLFHKLSNAIKSIFKNQTKTIVQQYKHLIDLSPEPIVILDKDKIIFVNSPAAKLFGASKTNELIGCSMIDFVEESFRDKARESLRQIIVSGKDSFLAEVKIFTIQKNYHFVQGIATKIFFENHEAILVMLRDISNMKAREIELEKIADDAKNLEKLKSQFLAQMSHEIRSPLNTLMASTSLIESEMNPKLKSDYKDYFSVMRLSSNKIMKTVGHILHSAELTSDLYKPNFKDLNIVDVVNQLVNEYTNVAEQKGIHLSAKFLTQHAIVTCDEYSVVQILTNILDNAIKYTNEGNVEINVKKELNVNLIVEIIDSGIGISEEYLPNIFDEFTQESQGNNRKYDGSGLGMSVVRRFADINNIHIDIESNIGEGTKFTLEFKFKPELKKMVYR